MINLRAGMLVAVVVVLAGCASQVSGEGSAASPSPSSSPPSTATSASPSTTPQATSVLRTAPADPLGDPVTTDFCYGITLSPFRKWGDPVFHPYQLADACFIDVLSGSNDLLIDIISHPKDATYDPVEPDHTMETADTIKELTGGNTEGIWSDDGTVCERAFGLPGVGISITEEQLAGKSTSSERCGLAQAALAQVAIKDRQAMPKRSLAIPSITRFDLCALLNNGGLEQLPNMDSTETTPDLGGAQCSVDGTGMTITVRYAFTDVDLRPLPAVTVQGHQLQVDGDDQGCDVVSQQGKTSDRSSYEIFDVLVSVSTASTKAALCTEGEKAAVVMLTAAHLK